VPLEEQAEHGRVGVPQKLTIRLHHPVHVRRRDRVPVDEQLARYARNA
jgi:hypothetical protein